ncbi:Outer membrane protein TolC [Robiginitalea myxolifaciens]|uniref:Outer membrane protein TolC n=1 Tax=Robiginitalea myxolifaciens TaxID=400055 RepID=A0A1I6HKJ2_9FLAO|nr:TolC family protein [Robiginitalea myxolifaciens]SFR54952.1 Outer membrane protein TolC [Robiginitalea myxolifaciens]
MMNRMEVPKSGIKSIIQLLLLFVVVVGNAQEKQTYRIGMMVDSRTAETSVLFNQLESEVKAVVGEDAIIEFPPEYILSNNFRVAQAKANYQQLLEGEVDIILALGSASDIVFQEEAEFPKPTVLFGVLNTDLSKLNLEQQTSGVENFSYLMGVQSFDADLTTLKELTDFERVGIAIERGIAESVPLEQTYDRVLARLEADYGIIPFESVEDIIAGIEGYDALYLAGGFSLEDAQIQRLSDALLQTGLPSFTSTGAGDVALGMMATNSNSNNIDQIIRRIALTIEAYVTGSNLADQRVFVDFEQRLTANFNTMQRLGVPIRYSLIARTDFVGEFQNQLSQKNYSLLDVINDNLERNLGLQAQLRDVELSSQDVKTAVSNYYPSVTANATFTNIDDRVAMPGISPEFSTDGNIQLNQTIFSEAANANISVQKNLQRAEQEIYNAAALDAILQASNLYFNALVSKVNARIQSQNLQLTKENLRIATQNYEAGQSGKSDMLRFQSQMAQNTQSMIEAVNQLEQSFIAINQLLNNPINYELDIIDARLGEGVFESYNYEELADLLDNPQLMEPFVAFLIEEAKNNSPELAALYYNLKAVERNFNFNTLGRLLPTVALQANYNQNFNQWGVASIDPDPDNNYNVGVNLSIPILNQFRTNINRQTARIQLDQLELNKQNTELAIESNISTAVLNVINQISNIRLSEVSVRAAEEALELVQTSYAEGAVSIIQLIDAQNNYLQAQLAQASATYNFLLNTIQLERFMGYNFLLHTPEENAAFRQRFVTFLAEN